MTESPFPVFTRDTWAGAWPADLPGALFVVNKPLGWSSFRVVGLLRKLLNIKKVGHAGTLDPRADGVLIVGVGKATKVIDQYQAQFKSYRATVRFGWSTPSYDAETEADVVTDASHITREMIETELAQSFTGEILQQPPIFSALKVNGQSAYKKARAGKPVELKARPVTIYTISVIDFTPPDLILDVDCGKGTYIRSIAHDLGIALGNRAHLAGLTRTAIGEWVLSSALDIPELIQQLDPNGTTGIAR